MASNAQAPSQGHALGKKTRGRTVAAGYLSSTSASSSRAAATPNASSSKPTPVPNIKTTRHTQANGQVVAIVKPTKSAGSVSAAAQARSTGMKPSSSVSKNLAPSASSSSLTKKTLMKDQRPTSVDVTRDQADPLTTMDTLQQAAQIQSWLFMSATLESSYASAKRSAAAVLEQRRSELAAEEADIADARVRFEAERLLEFYEELTAPQVASAIATLVQQFLTHEEACSRAVSEALQLVQQPANEQLRITRFNDVLDEIDRLLEEAAQLENSITTVVPGDCEGDAAVDDSPEHDRLKPALLALLPVVRAQRANLECAQALLQSSKHNLRVAISLQSLHIAA